MEFRNAKFVVTEENRCPLYTSGDEITVVDHALVFPEAKPTCMILVRSIIGLTSRKPSVEFSSPGKKGKNKYECDGCVGLIRFEEVQEVGAATVQMKLLLAAKNRPSQRNVNKTEFGRLFKRLPIFDALNDKDIGDLVSLMQVKNVEAEETILRHGDRGTHLFIVLSGRMTVFDEEGRTLANLEEGSFFGEMSLLSEGKVSATVVAAMDSKLATMSGKGFKHVITNYPALQVFFYRLLVGRIQDSNAGRTAAAAAAMAAANTAAAAAAAAASATAAMAAAAGVASHSVAYDLDEGISMRGQLSEILPVEVLQMVNANQKSGRLEMFFKDGRAIFSFREGELVRASFGDLEGKDAFFAVLGKTTGNFAFRLGLSEEEAALPVIDGFMGLIMEGLQRIDEHGD